jgi:diguanylate cyclase (GGDEF)-like protein
MYIEGAGTGTDTFSPPVGADPLLAGVRRLTLLADEATDSESILRGLARELLSAPGAEEVHVHHLAHPGVEEELVAVYMFAGDGRLSYLLPLAERPQGVSRVASTGRSLLVSDARELAANVPRLVLATSSPTEAGCAALLMPLAERGEVEAVVMLVGKGLSNVFTTAAIELATTLVEQAATALALVRARAEAGTDPVTGCMNHRAMRRRLHEEIGRATRTGSPLSCLLIDLDDFKLVNDRHGHQAGDATLRGVVQALAGEFRAFDRVARYGGDEFVVILPNADLESAAAAAARALQRLLEMSSPGTEHGGVSASIGVAQWQDSMSADALLEACDAALLRSKRQGKGRVTRASTLIR